jgi:integrase
MAYIAKLKTTGKWQAQIERNGQRKSKTFETKREAQAWALEQEATAKRARAGGNKSFGDAVDKYKADVSSKKDGEVWEVRRLEAMRELFGNGTELLGIDTPQIAEWRDTRLKTVSASTVVREANLLRNLFNLARREWKWIDHNPFDGVKLPKENAPRHQVWTWQLIKRVLRAPRIGKTAEMQLAFHIALRTGMRLGEVLAAPAAYDAQRRVVTLVNVAGARKTEARAQIPIGRIAGKLITRAKFTVSANEGSTLFSKLCRELLIEGLTFHDTRGTALTHLSKKVDVLTLAKISRHKDLSLLSNVYYRATADSIARLI